MFYKNQKDQRRSLCQPEMPSLLLVPVVFLKSADEEWVADFVNVKMPREILK